ncbi:MAG: dTDP-4-dehydrorhamnose reductase [Betaproteobacteria bacterium]|nr:dTDP-4-dehydrorhamnose reductase [Betaproteobacteria bacterium]NDF05305.1 dTDP-4-dehydrorhamnose reductase [Betaproteobacteria bacterium]
MAAEGVLLFGADGQLGHELQSELSVLGRLIPLTLADVDIADAKDLQAVIRHHAPRYIVNAAAYTAVDKAEQEPDLAQAINATAPGIMAAEAKSLGATMVHYSTDYVFNGQSAQPYKETDATDPLSVYGQSKRDGDIEVMAKAGAFFIFRSSWVVGAHGGNFLKTMLRLAQERDSLSVVADQHGVPTSARWMAQVTREALQHPQHADLSGLYHLSNAGRTTWHGYAQYVLTQAAQMGWQLKVKPEDVKAIGSADYPLPAPRPANSMLNTHLVQQNLGLTIPIWQTGVDEVLAALWATKV